MLDLLLSLALNASTPTAPPDGAYHYQTTGPESSGTSTITLQHVGPGVQVTETTAGSIDGIAATASSTMTLNADLTPASYTANYVGGGQNMRTMVTFNGAGASETFAGTATNPAQTYALDGAAGARPPHVPIIDLGLSVGGSIPLTEWYDPQTYVLDEVDIPSQSIAIIRTR